MNKITSLTEANRYIEDVEVSLWELEERVGRYRDVQPRMRIPFPACAKATSISEALQRLNDLVNRRNSAVRFMKALPEVDRQKELDHWRETREIYKDFNSIVQGYNPPHQ